MLDHKYILSIPFNRKGAPWHGVPMCQPGVIVPLTFVLSPEADAIRVTADGELSIIGSRAIG